MQTLSEIQALIDIVEEKRAKDGLSDKEKSELESESIRLRNIEREIIKTKK